MTIKRLRSKKFTDREKLICQYAKEVMLIAHKEIKTAIKANSSESLKLSLQYLEAEARMIGDDEKQLKNCLWIAQMIS